MKYLTEITPNEWKNNDIITIKVDCGEFKPYFKVKNNELYNFGLLSHDLNEPIKLDINKYSFLKLDYSFISNGKTFNKGSECFPIIEVGDKITFMGYCDVTYSDKEIKKELYSNVCELDEFEIIKR